MGLLYFHSIEAFPFFFFMFFFCFFFMGSLARLLFCLGSQEFGVPKLDVCEDELTTLFFYYLTRIDRPSCEQLDDLVVGTRSLHSGLENAFLRCMEGYVEFLVSVNLSISIYLGSDNIPCD